MNESNEAALRRAHEIYERLMREMRSDLDRRLGREPVPSPADLKAPRASDREDGR